MAFRKPRSILTIIILALISAYLINEGLTAAAAKKYDTTGMNHALIIGISDYQNWPKLESPARDAEKIAKLLLEKYDFKSENVTLLADNAGEKPTRMNILTALENYKNTLGANDNLLIVYTGHSAEDDKGQTYWIPREGKENTKLTWLGHTALVSDFFASPDFKVKSLCIITDSPFENKLFRPESNPLTPFDLRYPEKIQDKASRKGREIISFGDHHWPASKSTDNMGLFAYYIHKTLSESTLKIIDLENLIFTDDAMFRISKIAGTRLTRGRLRNSPDQGGQFTVTRLAPSPVIDVLDATVTPKKGFPGERFLFEARTSRPAGEVIIEINGKRHYMKGKGTAWEHYTKLPDLKDVAFSVVAINDDDMAGKSVTGGVTIVKKPAPTSNILVAAVSPQTGNEGDHFLFTAKTDKPADRVSLFIKGNRYEMTGTGTEWSLDQPIATAGTIDYSVVATNEDDRTGHSKNSRFVVRATPVNIVHVAPEPASGYAGDEFLIKVNTDRPAKSVSVEIDGKTYAMEGTGKQWQFRQTIAAIGPRQFVAVARNSENKEGQPKTGTLSVVKRPLAAPDIAVLSINPDQIFPGDTFIVKAETTTDAAAAFLELDGKRLQMAGSGNQWTYQGKLDDVGKKSFQVAAVNDEGKQGALKTSTIQISQRLAEAVNVVAASVSPETGSQGDDFTFTAKTDGTSESVFITIGKNRYQMTGSGKQWTLKRKITDYGTLTYSMVATNKDGITGSSKTGEFKISVPTVSVADIMVPSRVPTGEAFLIMAKTDRPARSVSIEIAGTTYPMKKSGNQWLLETSIPEPGKTTFTVVAKNAEDRIGPPRFGSIVSEKEEIAVPQIASIQTTVVAPGKGYAGDTFLIAVTTTSPSDVVYLNIDGEQLIMEGAGTNWRFLTRIDQVGKTPFTVAAKNIDGVMGSPKQSDIQVAMRPEEPVHVMQAAVNPESGIAGKSFTFTGGTDKPAESVTLVIGNRRYPMNGSGTTWSLTQKMEQPGKFDFSIVAKNQEGVEGDAKWASLAVEEIKQRYQANTDGTVTDVLTGQVQNRFMDNGDGTVTDLLSNLMWMKEPKQIALNYDNAVEYCRSLDFRGYSGWRLPTIEEWQQLSDPSKENPALPSKHPFRDILTHIGYWSKSRHKFGPKYVYQMELWYGKIGYLNKDSDAIVWPVRFAESQG